MVHYPWIALDQTFSHSEKNRINSNSNSGNSFLDLIPILIPKSWWELIPIPILIPVKYSLQTVDR